MTFVNRIDDTYHKNIAQICHFILNLTRILFILAVISQIQKLYKYSGE